MNEANAPHSLPAESLNVTMQFCFTMSKISFSLKSNGHLTIMQGGEYYFHTDEQMKFLDQGIQGNLEELLICYHRFFY